MKNIIILSILLASNAYAQNMCGGLFSQSSLNSVSRIEKTHPIDINKYTNLVDKYSYVNREVNNNTNIIAIDYLKSIKFVDQIKQLINDNYKSENELKNVFVKNGQLVIVDKSTNKTEVVILEKEDQESHVKLRIVADSQTKFEFDQNANDFMIRMFQVGKKSFSADDIEILNQYKARQVDGLFNSKESLEFLIHLTEKITDTNKLFNDLVEYKNNSLFSILPNNFSEKINQLNTFLKNKKGSYWFGDSDIEIYKASLNTVKKLSLQGEWVVIKDVHSDETNLIKVPSSNSSILEIQSYKKYASKYIFKSKGSLIYNGTRVVENNWKSDTSRAVFNLMNILFINSDFMN